MCALFMMMTVAATGYAADAFLIDFYMESLRESSAASATATGYAADDDLPDSDYGKFWRGVTGKNLDGSVTALLKADIEREKILTWIKTPSFILHNRDGILYLNAFSFCIWREYKELVVAFLEYGVNVDDLGVWGRPVKEMDDFCNAHSYHDVKYGIMDSSIHTTGDTPLHIAIYRALYNTDIIELLLERGADINKRNQSGDTPLCIAAFVYYHDVIELLLEHGADIDKQNQDGQTPLHIATETEYVCNVEYLLAKGANMTLTDSNGRKAYDLATTPEMKALFQKEKPLRERRLALWMGSDYAPPNLFRKIPPDVARWIISQYLRFTSSSAAAA